MDPDEFVKFGRATLDFIVDYKENIRDRTVLPNVEPGYLSELLPEEAPEKGETWQEVLEDVQKVILPGMTHWCSPYFFAYYPTAFSYPSMIGELLTAGLTCMGFSWMTSPVSTELEVVTLNWLGKMLNLPPELLHCNEGPGGGVIQGSASEATLVCLLAAKERTVRRIKDMHPEWDENTIKSKLIAYSSDQSNSSVEKAGMLGDVTMKLLPSDENQILRSETFLKAIEKDLEDGLIPFYAVATLGTTGTCAFDDVNGIGPICNEHSIWLHIDAAFAGIASICPEYRYLMSGIQYANSFNVNCHKWMLVNFDCSALWVKDSRDLINAFNIERIYLSHEKEGLAPDYRHWQISLGRRFRSLKLWIVLRVYGIEGIRKHVRDSIKIANIFLNYVKSDERFEVLSNKLTVICFRLKGDESLTTELLARITKKKRIYLIAATINGKYVIRFATGSGTCTEEDVKIAWNEISQETREMLDEKTKQLEISEKNICDDMAYRIENLNLETKNTSQTIS